MALDTLFSRINPLAPQSWGMVERDPGGHPQTPGRRLLLHLGYDV